MSREFVVEETPEGRTLVVTGRWSDAAEAVLHRPDVDGLWLNYARGFSEPDLSFVKAWPIRRLLLIDRTLGDLSPLGRLGESLEDLSIQAALGTAIELAMFPNLRSIFAGWDAVRGSLGEPTYLTHLGVMDYSETDLAPLMVQPSLQAIRLKVASPLESLTGIGGIPTLTRLQIAAAPRLGELEEIATVSATLRELDLEKCGSVVELAAIEALQDLQFLGLGDCGAIDSFRPLASLRRLERLYAWGSTRVVDGDLSPLLQLRRLTEIRMRDRRDYRPRLDEIKSQLGCS